MLAVGTALPMILGFFFVRPIPPPHLDAAARVEHGTHSESTEYGVVEGLVASPPTTFSRNNSSQTHLLARDADASDSEDDDEPRAAIELDVEGESEGGGEDEGAHAHAQLQGPASAAGAGGPPGRAAETGGGAETGIERTTATAVRPTLVGGAGAAAREAPLVVLVAVPLA